VTQYLTEPAVRSTFQFLANAPPGSRLMFTYVLRDFIDGQNTYGQDTLYRRFRVTDQVWRFGLQPADVAAFVGPYTWKVLEDVGAVEYTERYLGPAGRTDPVARIERAVHAMKVLESA